MTAIMGHRRRLSIGAALTVLLSAAVLALTGTAASAKAYDYGDCLNSNRPDCTTSPAITSSAAGRLIFTITTNDAATGTWQLKNSTSVVHTGNYSGYRYSLIITDLPPNSGSYTLYVNTGNAQHLVLVYLCNFTTYSDGSRGPCLF